jgi:NAD+ diphosphatase
MFRARFAPIVASPVTAILLCPLTVVPLRTRWSTQRTARVYLPGGMEANTFAGGTLDRAGEHRTDEEWIKARLSEPDTRAVVAGRKGVLVHGDPPQPALVVPPKDAPPTLLGLQDGRALFAVDLEDVEPPEGTRVVGLREVSAALAAPDAALMAYAVALLEWQRRHRFCGTCGAPNELREAGHLLQCTREGTTHHPRTDPVVIVLVTDGHDRALLGRQAVWPAGRWSALAGFVEPGESLEEAVAREVEEESGVQVTDVRYISSQPWPFPANLMMGFHARATGGDPVARDGELEAVGWFERAQIAEAAAAPDAPWAPDGDHGPDAFLLPPREAIARQLVEAWLAAGPSAR